MMATLFIACQTPNPNLAHSLVALGPPHFHLTASQSLPLPLVEARNAWGAPLEPTLTWQVIPKEAAYIEGKDLYWGSEGNAELIASMDGVQARWTFTADPMTPEEEADFKALLGGYGCNELYIVGPRPDPRPPDPPYTLRVTHLMGRDGRSQLRIGDPTVYGELTLAQTDTTLATVADRVAGCTHGEGGYMIITLHIGQNGHVIATRVIRSSFPDAAYDPCVRNALESLTFPASNVDFNQASYTFDFSLLKPTVAPWYAPDMSSGRRIAQ